MNKLAIFLIVIFVANTLIVTTNAQGEANIQLYRLIEVYPGFLVVKDRLSIEGGIYNLSIYLSMSEYENLYSIYLDKGFPIQWGLLKGNHIGFSIPLNNYQGNLTLTRVYSEGIFIGLKPIQVEIPAYLVTDYELNNLVSEVEFKYSVINVETTSPKEVVKSFIGGRTFLKYNATSVKPFNNTPLTFTFEPQEGWLKIENLTRNLIIDNLDYVKVVDTFMIKYIGRAQVIKEWKPYLLPNAKVISVSDSLGDLTYSNEVIQLRYPLTRALYQGALLNQTKATITIVSEIRLEDLGTVDKGKGSFNVSLDVLRANNLLIDNLEVKITVKHFKEINIEPIPDSTIKGQDGIDYVFFLKNVDPSRSFKVDIKGTINPYIYSLYTVSQALILVLILLAIFAAYLYFSGPSIISTVKIPEIPKFINLVEELMLNNEEIERLEEELEKGTIKKQDYNLKINRLKNEIRSKENYLKSLSSSLLTKHPETKQIITAINEAYYGLLKEQNNLRELKNSYKTKKIQPSVYKRTLEIHMNAIRNNKAKLDNLLNQLREKYMR